MYESIVKKLGLALVFGVLAGCGGGGGSSSASAEGAGSPPTGGSSAPVSGIATPSSVSVVTAQNADAGS
jgi:hypothetical protein